MATADTQELIRQSVLNYDSSIDVSPGSRFDRRVIQPLLERLGTDPFTVDVVTFLQARVKQAYPALAADEADNLTDMLIKPMALLVEPLVRENQRVRLQLGLSNTEALTTAEVDALGGTFFVPRDTGEFATGTFRVFFDTPQQVRVTPQNYITVEGLRYFPTVTQTISAEEMILNESEGRYYLDVSVRAESQGSDYNISSNRVGRIADIESASEVRSARRFRFGVEEESVGEYVSRLETSLGEKSFVSLRGAAAKVLDSTDADRVNVVGFGDEEMRRDVLRGGGLGGILASGVAGFVVSDGEGQSRSRRFASTEVNWQEVVGNGARFVLTVFASFDALTVVRDLDVRAAYNTDYVDLEESALPYGASGLRWMLRRREMTLSDIPGGIVFPNLPNGALALPDDEVHIGGAYDVHVRGSEVEDLTMTVAQIVDDAPLLLGQEATVVSVSGSLRINLGISRNVDFLEGDATDLALAAAAREGYTIQLQSGVNANVYRIVGVSFQTGTNNVLLQTAEDLTVASAVPARWRLFDVLDIDLLEPKETLAEGVDLVTIQGQSTVTTTSGTDFTALGVQQGDILRIFSGEEAGDYVLAANPSASGAVLPLDAAFPRSNGNLSYTVIRPRGDSMQLPLMRVTSIEVLDEDGQPEGTPVPLATPIDIQTRAFQNPARGVKHSFVNGQLGVVSAEANPNTLQFAGFTGGTLFIRFAGVTYTVTLTSGMSTPTAVVTAINTQLAAFLVADLVDVAALVGNLRFGLRPVGNGFIAVVGGTAMAALFGATQTVTSADVRTTSIPTWTTLRPSIDEQTGLDVVQVVNGLNAGVYPSPWMLNPVLFGLPSTALVVARNVTELEAGDGYYFSPTAENQVRIGSRSLGSARVYFREPTSWEARYLETVFTVDLGTGGVLEYEPDPTLDYQKLPALPGGDVIGDGAATGGSSTWTSSSQDFVRSGIRTGDKLEVRYWPLEGTAIISTDPIPALVGLTLVFSVDGGPDRTVTFIQDDASLNVGEVTRDGVVTQINAALGDTIAAYTLDGRLRFYADQSLVVRATGTANDVLLGEVSGHLLTEQFSDADQNNTSPLAGTYEVASVTATQLTIQGTFSVPSDFSGSLTEQTYRVLRSGVQRACTAEMAQNVDDLQLYYFDVELVSRGVGDVYNIDAGLQMRVRGDLGDGWRMTTDDENLAFSTAERPRLVISRTILQDGVDDDPSNATELTGRGLQIAYERSGTVDATQALVASESERVVCSNPLARHLIPHYVRISVGYTGELTEADAEEELSSVVRSLYAVDLLRASTVQKTLQDLGAQDVSHPIHMVGIVHYPDRSIYAQRSNDTLGVGRLNTFIPDVFSFTRTVS